MRLVVIGAQWGDEGKGKIVDFLAEKADIVLRFSGGANAGHTIVRGDTTYKLHLVPSGIVSPRKIVVLGIGMVIDPRSLFEELDGIAAQGIPWEGRVLVSDRAHLVLPRYRDLDKERDRARATPIGTTGRGIGVTYALKAFREGIRVADLYDQRIWASLPREDKEFLEPLRERLRPLVTDVSRLMASSAGKNTLFEGAQGALLDLDFGTYPYVSSGVSAAGGAPLGAGIGPHAIDRVIGVSKAYSTRVGNGPFPTELTSDRDGGLGETLRRIGKEYGVTTGRPRRCGYLDLVALRYAVRCNSIDYLALTKLDVLDGMKEIKVCTAYKIGDRQISEFPTRLDELESAEPVTERFAGWERETGKAKQYEELPQKAQDYIRFIEEYAGVPVTIVSVGSEREETIVRKDPWTRS